MNATSTVVENKLMPVSASVDKDAPTVTFTAQTATKLFQQYRDTIFSGEGKVVAILRDILQASSKADAKETALALSGMVEGTRSTVDGKRIDGPDTALARKFQSMARSVYGAVRFAGMSIATVEQATNSQKLYDEARECLKIHGLDWSGMEIADKLAKREARALKSAIIEVAEETGTDALLSTSEEFKALRDKAADKLRAKAAQDKLASMEKRAEKIADDLIKSYGIDDAETVLKRALEVLAAKVIGAVA